MPYKKNKKNLINVVVIGGGTGTHTALRGLKAYNSLNLTAIVSMTDNGGSTGVLRDELGVLPPGDIRQCLVALSESDRLMRDLFNYRFSEGGLKGHSFGNLLLSALEKTSGSFDEAVSKASQILNVRGAVVPVTLQNINLYGTLINKKILRGEKAVTKADLGGHHQIAEVYLKPKAKANPKAMQAIRQADLIVVAPGTIYVSIIPVFLVEGIVSAIHDAKAKKIVVCNLMAKGFFTRGFNANDFLTTIEKYAGRSTFDYLIYNNREPAAALLRRYKNEGTPVAPPIIIKNAKRPKFIGKNLLSRDPYHPNRNDPLLTQRTLIRHDPKRLAKIIVDIIKREKLG